MNESQTRRIQLSGGSTYVVSLPKAWMDKMGAGAGDQVTLVRGAGSSMTMFASSEPESRPEATISIGRADTEESVKRKMIAAYLRGYTSMRVVAKGMRIDPSHARAVKSLVKTSMVGTEIVESSSESIGVQVLARLPELSFEAALSRMRTMAASMHREAMEALLSADSARSEEVAGMDDEVDRFGLYMRRNLSESIGDPNMLREMGLRRASDCLGYQAVITRTERVADHAVMIAKRTKFLDGGIEPGLAGRMGELSECALGVFEGAFAALGRRDYRAAEAAAAEAARVVEREKSAMAGVRDSDGNAGVARFVLEDIRRVAEYSEDIAEVAIDQNIDSVIGVG